MSPTLANFLFEAANFLLLAGILGWLLFKPVRTALDAERTRRAQDEQRAAEQRAEAEDLAREARQARAQLSAELDSQRADLLAAARSEAARIKDEARQAQDAELRALEHELAAARRTQAGALADTLGRIAAASLRALLDTLDGPSLDLALVRGACNELATLTGQGTRQGAGHAAVVETARPLGSEARALLRQVLDGPFEERTVPDLGAGIRVTTATAQVDASALALARRAAHEVTLAAREPGSEEPGNEPHSDEPHSAEHGHA